MGLRSSATQKLEQAFAAAFQAYFVGDPTFIRPGPTQASIFTPAQSVDRLIMPQVSFLCVQADEQIANTAIYMGTLEIYVDTALNERADDYISLKALHDDRLNKLFILIGNVALLQSIINAPAAGPDLRSVQDFRLYGLGKIVKEIHTKESNRLCSLVAIEVPFQPI